MSRRAEWAVRGAAALGTLLAAAYFLYQQWPDVKHQLHGYTFSETLPKTVGAVGELSRVLSVLDRDGNISFAVVTADGRVLERYYGDVCTSSAKGPNCARREKHGERRASGRERELAQVRIGDLDPGVVGRLRRASGSGRQVPVGLRRRQWALVPTGGAPYVADADGGRLHRAVSAAERALARAVAEDSGLR